MINENNNYKKKYLKYKEKYLMYKKNINDGGKLKISQSNVCVPKKKCTIDKKIKKTKRLLDLYNDNKCLIYTYIDNFLKNKDEIVFLLDELIYYKSFNLLKLILDSKINFDINKFTSKTSETDTLLFNATKIAIKENCLKILNLLLEKGADPTKKSLHSKFSPIELVNNEIEKNSNKKELDTLLSIKKVLTKYIKK